MNRVIKGLDHFKSRQENIEDILSSFEIENEIEFPLYYRLFLKTYEESICLPLVNDQYLQRLYLFGINNHNDLKQIDFIKFHESEQTFDILFDGIDVADPQEMFLIAKTPLKEGIFVGVTDSFKDKIFLYNHTDEVQFKLLANDIFEFISYFESKLETNRSFSTSQLYKNWDENFWRVRYKDT